jgi:hypothetical protein
MQRFADSITMEHGKIKKKVYSLKTKEKRKESQLTAKQSTTFRQQKTQLT